MQAPGDYPPLRHDWFVEGVELQIRSLEMIRSGIFPPVLQSWSVVTTALWLLRTVYGDDLTSAAEIRKLVLAEEAERLKQRELSAAFSEDVGIEWSGRW